MSGNHFSRASSLSTHARANSSSMAPREHLGQQPRDVPEFSARSGGYAQSPKEDHGPNVARDDRPADEERELDEKREDAEAEEGTRDDGGLISYAVVSRKIGLVKL